MCQLLIQVCYLLSFTLMVFYNQPRGCRFNSSFLVPPLLPESFPVSFSSMFLSNIFNFFPIIPNIPDQTSYHPIYTVSLLYTSLIILLYETFYNLLFLPILTPFHTLLQTFLPGLLHFLSSPLVPKCLLLLYIPSIALGTYPFL